MSKSTFLTTQAEKGCFIVRDELHKALYQEGLIEEISLDGCIDITEFSTSSTLKKVSISQLNYSDSKSQVEKIWKIDLEHDIAGISTQAKTTESALLVLQKFSDNNYKLNIILIELKSSLQEKKQRSGKTQASTLTDIEDKLRCTMNRMYMLMTLNNYKNPKRGYAEADIHVQFKGIIFYNKNSIKSNDGSQLYPILTKSQTSSLISCATILRSQDKIEIKFFPKKPSDRDDCRQVQLKNLL